MNFVPKIAFISGCIAAFAFIFSGCVKEPLSPVMPSWDVDLTFPLLSRTYSIGQIVSRDTSLLRAGSGNTLSIVTSSDVPPMYVGNNISFASRNISASMKLGIFSLALQPIVSPVVLQGFPQGQTVPIRDTIITVPTLYDTISTFESASLVEGTMTLTFRNNLPVPVDVVGSVYMIDDANRVIATFAYNPSMIPSNASRSAQDDLASKTIGSPQTVGNIVSIAGLVLHVHGSAGPVQIPFGSMMVATITTNGLKANRAVNVLLPSQRFENSDSLHVLLSDSTLIQDVIVRSGGFNVTMQNTLDMDVIFKYRFDELFRPLGGGYVAYEDSTFIPRFGSVVRPVNTAGYRIHSLDGDLLTSLQVVSTIVVPISGVVPITLNDTDNVKVTLATADPFVADSAIGVIKPTWVSVNAVLPLGLKNLFSKFRAQLSIPSASLSFSTQSSIGFPMDLSLRLGAQKESGDSIFLDVPASERRVNPGTGEIQFDGVSVGQFLSQLSGRLPDSIRISGRTLVNPQDVYNPTISGVGHVGRNSSLSGKIDLQIPLTLGITNGIYSDTVAFGDTSGTGRQGTTDKSRLDNMNSGKMYIQVENRTALRVDVALHLQSIGRQNLLALPKPGNVIRVESAQVNAAGDVTTPTMSTIVLELNGEDAQQFKLAEYLAYSLSFVSTPGAPVVKIKTSDSITLRMWSNFSYRVK